MEKEAKARIKINKLLEQAGWRLLDGDDGKANVQFEGNVKITQKDLDAFGEDYENTKSGYVDYVLLGNDGFPICVLEAKSEDKNPLVGKEQAREYAQSLKVRYIILSNGNLHYLWDRELGNPTRISYFPDADSLHDSSDFKPDRNKLVNEDVDDDYIALTQNPKYAEDPRWSEEDGKKEMIERDGLRFLRPYQLNAVKSIQKAVSEDKNRFLFEMATGTGKTLIAAAVIKLFLKTKNASRVLFLVDRLELEDQARKNFVAYLSPDYTTVVYKENRDDWQKAEVVVTTIQSISHDNKFLRLFSPNDFDLIISDESHRSISGSNRTIFEYFTGYKLGLTATPKDYLRNIEEEELSDEDPRELERRILLSTYKTFGCESGQPTFRYSLLQGVKDGYLVNLHSIDCRTDITTELLSEEGYAIVSSSEPGEDDDAIYHARDFERRFFSEETNRKFVEFFMEKAFRDPLSEEIGKSIFFCVSQNHAAKITQMLNEYASEMFPGMYNSDFAVQVTSSVINAQQHTIRFANNNLNGTTRFLEGYKSSKTRVCVTVGMMTTGYDCQDILNLAMLRPIFSPTDFIQIKGRGTRKYLFKYTTREDGKDREVKKDKEKFKLFDFFANCEYFEEDYPYDEVLALPKVYKPKELSKILPGILEESGEKGKRGKGIYTGSDFVRSVKDIEIDENGMKIDRKLYADKFEEDVKEEVEENTELKTAIEEGDMERAERIVKERLFNRPEDYYTMQRLREGYSVDRRLFLGEILEKIFGRIDKFKSRDELAEEEYESYTIISDVPPELFYEAKDFFKRYLSDETFRRDVNVQEFSKYSDDPVMWETIRKLGKDRMMEMAEYVKDNVNMQQYYPN